MVSKVDFAKGIRAIYDVYCEEGLDWELNVFESHFLFALKHISSEYKIIPINEKIDLSNCSKRRFIIKYI